MQGVHAPGHPPIGMVTKRGTLVGRYGGGGGDDDEDGGTGDGNDNVIVHGARLACLRIRSSGPVDSSGRAPSLQVKSTSGI